MKSFVIIAVIATLVGLASAHSIDFEHFWSLDEIDEYMEDLLVHFPHLFSTELAGRTSEGREIRAYRISTGGAAKPTILVDSGMQGRDWLSIMFSMYIIHEIVEHDYAFTDILNAVDLVFIPVSNPDGFVFSQTAGNRAWNKNRRSVGSGCFGVNINRNFGIEFAASADPCDENFTGAAAFSEEESRAVRSILESYRANLRIVVSLQSGGSQILYPYNFRQLPSVNEVRLRELGNAVNQAMNSNFNVGSAGILNRVESGTVLDYSYGNARVVNSFVWRLQGENWEYPENQLQSTLGDLFRGFLVFARRTANV